MRRFIKKIIGFIAFLIGLALVFGFTAVAAFSHFNSAPEFAPEAASRMDGLAIETVDGTGNTVRFDVRRGESARSVGRRLADAGLIRNEFAWNLYCRYNNEPVKAGSYLIEIPSTLIAIHALLAEGRQELVRVTIPEGFTLKKMARLLENAGICPADDFLAATATPEIISRYRIPGTSMEGYLYPDTYLFPAGYPAERVVAAMADTFFSRLGAFSERAAAMPPNELYRLVTLASIVEREYRVPDEAPVMAGVFLNRLGINMRLESCATVEYIITEIQGKPHPDRIFYADLEIRNPFNTYMYPGLPPGPISAPGAVALRAALYPENTNYLYFRLINQRDGRHYFSRTHDEHISAGALYVKGSP
ncbi:MAG: endolytic transglycosylase MltG [Treponema sp.]|nr:endolytic transglycosylase MltG [Treponema sp.]